MSLGGSRGGQHPGVPPTLALSRELAQKGSMQLVGMGWPLSLGAWGRAPQILSHAVSPPQLQAAAQAGEGDGREPGEDGRPGRHHC